MTARACPTCRQPVTQPKYRPFCSKRCADVDLQRWFSGAYAVPVIEDRETPDDDAPSPLDTDGRLG
jgi:endogenous inhibitor of DNA gyrase (YacG/DUF329 family)